MEESDESGFPRPRKSGEAEWHMLVDLVEAWGRATEGRWQTFEARSGESDRMFHPSFSAEQVFDQRLGHTL